MLDTRRLAQRWREYQESLTGEPTPTVPPHLQVTADEMDAALLLAFKPELATAK